MVSYSLHRAYAVFSTNPGSENAPVTSRRLIQIQAWISMATKLGAVRSLQKAFKPAALLAAVTGCLEAAKRSSSSFSTAGGYPPRDTKTAAPRSGGNRADPGSGSA